MWAKRALFLILGLSLALLAPAALAQKQLSPEERAAASAAFERAEAAYEDGDFRAALRGYQEAYDISQKPELLFNIGQCQRKLGQNEQAIGSYRAFLDAVPDTPLRSDVEKLIADLEALLPPPQEPTLLDRILKKRGKAQDGAPGSQPASEPASPSITERATERVAQIPRSTWLFTAAAAGGAAGLTTGVIGLSAAIQSKNLAEEGSFGESRARRSRALAFGVATDLLLVGGAAAAGMGYKLKQSEKATITLSASPSGAALSVRF